MKQLFTLLLIFAATLGFAQEETFNSNNGLIIDIKGSILFESDFTIAPLLGYKFGRFIVFTSYEKANDDLEMDMSTPDDNIQYKREVLKIGVQIYPHKNQKKVKLFYQAHYSYKWSDEIRASEYSMINVGTGIQYSITHALSAGTNVFIGFGNEKTPRGETLFPTYDLGGTIFMRYHLDWSHFRKSGN
ncbi:hypothetical protein KDU71_18935 [Carboxylicivirga sediminis]|uniref:DUF3575 domain-containing protein n=1 Tax=Carboxylicivirga sediminis TaxID=2006564 RepID=A0A941F8K5_9BACT|nr:hypothetical protein [Carboxylicivirga sediminis]MBR8537653.1 hypothetical protein [Carboxylicivirga sediminis]